MVASTSASNKTAVFAVSGLVALAVVLAAFFFYRHRSNAAEVDRLIEEAAEARDLLNDPSKSMVLLRDALRLDSDSARVHGQIGRTCLALDRVSDAVVSLEKAVQLAPMSEQPPWHIHLGQAFRRRFEGSRKRSDYNMAVVSFNQAMDSDELRAESLYHLGMLALDRAHKESRASENGTAPIKDFEVALQHFEKLMKNHPDFENRDQVQKSADLVRRILASAR